MLKMYVILLTAGSPSEQGEWVLAERWRGVERPLPPDAPVLHVLAAWGDARHEVGSAPVDIPTGSRASAFTFTISL